MQVNAYGVQAADKALAPLQITRRAPGPHDVQIDIAYCGVCHSDLHQVRSGPRDRGARIGRRFACIGLQAGRPSWCGLPG